MYYEIHETRSTRMPGGLKKILFSSFSQIIRIQFSTGIDDVSTAIRRASRRERRLRQRNARMETRFAPAGKGRLTDRARGITRGREKEVGSGQTTIAVRKSALARGR